MAYDDMIAVRDSLLSAIDNEMLKVSMTACTQRFLWLTRPCGMT